MGVACFIRDDECALKLPHVLGIDSEVCLQWDLHMHSLGNVDEAATAPDRAIERGKLVVVRRNDGGEVPAEEVFVLAQCSSGVHKNDALALQILAHFVVYDLAFILSSHTG